MASDLLPESVSKRLFITSYLELFTAIKDRDIADIRGFCLKMENKLQKVYDHHMAFMDGRENPDIDEKVVKKTITKLVEEAKDEELKTWFEEMCGLQQQMEENFPMCNFKYQINQCYVLAKILRDNAKYSIAAVPAGGGKTFIILSLIFYFLYKLQGCTVHVITCNELLKTQLEEVLRPYLKGNNNVILTDQSFPDPNTKKLQVALIDESD